MMHCLGLVLIATVMAESAPPVDPKKPEPNKAAKSVKVIYKKSESHLFSGSKLKGELKKPELSYIYERKGLRQEQIVNIPENFNDEIIKGAGQF